MTHDENPWIEYLTLLDGPFEYVPRPEWPDAVCDQFLDHGLVREAVPLNSVHCPCEGRPICDVIWCERGGERRPVRCCPTCGPTEMSISQVAQWQVSQAGHLAWLATLLSLRGTPESLVPHHLWRVGRLCGTQHSTTVFFGRALRACSPTAVNERLAQSRSAVLLVPRDTPDWAVPHPVIPLDVLITWAGATWSLQPELLALAPAPKARKRVPRRKKGPRLAVTQELREELVQHLRAARDHVQAARDCGREATLLPCPTRGDLAKRCRSSAATVSRCFAQDEELRRIWNLAHDLDALTRSLDR